MCEIYLINCLMDDALFCDIIIFLCWKLNSIIGRLHVKSFLKKVYKLKLIQ